MNLVSIEIKIRGLTLRYFNEHPQRTFLSIRLGTVLSSLTEYYPHSDPSRINQQETCLILNCEQAAMKTHSRLCLVIYAENLTKEKPMGFNQNSRDSEDNRTIVGMTFIPLHDKHNTYQKYRIQQCEDPLAQIQLSFSINSIEVKKIQTSSQASRSSYAEIKQFHNLLSHHKTDKWNEEITRKKNNHKRNESALDQPPRLFRNSSSQHNNPSNKRIKTQEQAFGESAESSGYEEPIAADNNQFQERLNKAIDKNMILTNLLIIEQTKFREAQTMIEKMIKINGLSQTNTSKSEKYLSQNKNKLKSNACQVPRSRFSEGEKVLDENDRAFVRYEQQISILMKERDELYSISQQLFERTKNFKQANQKLERDNFLLQRQIQDLNTIIEQNNIENIELKKQLFEISDQNQKEFKNGVHGSSESQYQKKINELQNKNKEMDRKMKQSLKAITNFKNDALEAQEQIILKDQEIEHLKSLINKNGQVSLDVSWVSINKGRKVDGDLRKIINLDEENRKNQLQLAQEHRKYLEEVDKMERRKNEESLKVINDIKDRVSSLYSQYSKKKMEKISIMEMRKQLMIFLNSYQNS